MELVERFLVRTPGNGPTGAEWTYARWKPGVSMTAAYTVHFADGSTETIACKRYAGTKASAIQERTSAGGLEVLEDGPLEPCAVLPASRLVLSSLPFDRELPGLSRLFDSRRTARWLRGLDLFPGLDVRPGPMRCELLRYKPEHRAVLRLDLRLRPLGEGPRRKRRLAVRVLPPGVARRVAAARFACRPPGTEPCFPVLRGVEERTGTLIEEWLELDEIATSPRGLAREAGALAARLHGAPCSGKGPVLREPGLEELEPLFTVDDVLRRRVAGWRMQSFSASSAWIHGDLHREQLVQDTNSGVWRLLDLDQLQVGDPVRDLASWITDHLLAHPDAELIEASGALLESYRSAGGAPPDAARLSAAVAQALVRAAAACVRRLERDAVERAIVLLDRARDLAPRGALFR